MDNSTHHPSTQDIFDFASSTPDRHLSDQEKQKISGHLDACEACRAEAEEVHRIDQIASQIEDLPSLSPEEEEISHKAFNRALKKLRIEFLCCYLRSS